MPSVDKRVVEMQFNNAQFETNANKSIQTLNKLKSSLDLSGSAKGLSEIQNAGNSFNLSKMESALSNISDKFSMFGILGVTAMQRVANAAINTGESVIRALAINSIIDGWHEYGLELNSVQTIMAGTGKSASEVYKRLDILNTYADQTIYSFSDMTSSIGKFTNAGVDLDLAVGAIKGIANEAALSGANTNEASRAMYNFAQALSAGSVKLIDWMSIENANMATAEFKQQLIDTALAMGTITDAGDGFYKTMEGNKFSVGTFREALSDKWLTSDVLITTLNKYADATTDIGKRATQAATQIKTLNQLWDVLTEEAGSGWAITWKLIVGDIDQTKELFTNIGTHYQTLMSNMSNARNQVLKDWQELGGRNNIIQGLYLSVKQLESVIGSISGAFSEVFPPITGEVLAKISSNFRLLVQSMIDGAPKTYAIKGAFEGLFSVFKLIGVVVKPLFTSIANGLSYIQNPINDIVNSLGFIGIRFKTFVDQIANNQQIAGSLNVIFGTLGTTLKLLMTIFGSITTIIGELIQKFVSFVGFSDGIGSVLGGIASYAGSATEFLNDLISKIQEVTNEIVNFIRGSSDLTNAGKGIGQILGGIATSGVKLLGDSFKGLLDLLGSLAPALSGLVDVAKDALGGLVNAISTIIGNFTSNLSFETVFNAIAAIFTVITAKDIKNFIGSFDGLKDLISQFTGLDKITGVLDGVRDSLATWKSSLNIANLEKTAIALGILAASLIALSTVNIDSIGPTLVLLGGAMGEITLFAEAMGAASKSFGKVAGSLIPFAAGLVILAAALKILSTIDASQIAGTLVILGGALGEIAIFAETLASVSKQFATVAVGFVIFAAGITVLAVALKILATMDVEDIAVSLGVLAGALTIFGAAMFALSPIASTTLTVSAAVALFGAGLLAAAIGVTLFTTALMALAAAGPIVMAGVTTLAAVGVAFVVALMAGLASATGLLVSYAATIIVDFMDGLASRMNDLVQAGFNLIIAFINGISEGLESNSPALFDACGNMLSTMATIGLDLLLNRAPEFFSAALEWVGQLLSGVGSMLGNVGTAAGELIQTAITNIQQGVSDFFTAGSNAVQGFIDGLLSGLGGIASAAIDLANQAWSSLTGALDEHSPSKLTAKAGKWFDQGLINGMDQLKTEVGKASESVGNTAVESIADSLTNMPDISSMGYEESLVPVIDFDSVNRSISDINDTSNAQLLKFKSSIDASYLGSSGDTIALAIERLQNSTIESNDKLWSAIDELRTDINNFYENANTEIAMYVDSKKLASSLAKPMNQQLGMLSRRGGI